MNTITHSKRIVTTLLFAVSIFGNLVARTTAPQTWTPKFQDYPVTERFRGKPAPVNLNSHPKARLVRTQLIAGARRSPNFAGHYTVVVIGCGTACQMVGIVDAKTGRVYFLPDGVEDVSYRANSSLLIVNPPSEGASPTEAETRYYQWANGKLLKIGVD